MPTDATLRTFVAPSRDTTVTLVPEHLRREDRILGSQGSYGVVQRSEIRSGMSQWWYVVFVYAVSQDFVTTIGGTYLGPRTMEIPRTTLLRVRLGNRWDRA